jgi:DNA-binding response OmpR family regulator
MRILLVEDEPDAARLLAKGLREQAYAVDTRPTDALRSFERKRPSTMRSSSM